ncbi:MAG: helix-turn-helix domain-containing protein [Terriglobales bacterium]
MSKGTHIELSETVPIKVGTPLEVIERIMILRTLQATKDDRVLAAKVLGISVKTLERKMKPAIEMSRARTVSRP